MLHLKIHVGAWSLRSLRKDHLCATEGRSGAMLALDKRIDGFQQLSHLAFQRLYTGLVRRDFQFSEFHLGFLFFGEFVRG